MLTDFCLRDIILAFLFEMPHGFYHFLIAILMTIPNIYCAPAVCQTEMDALHAQSNSSPYNPIIIMMTAMIIKR